MSIPYTLPAQSSSKYQESYDRKSILQSYRKHLSSGFAALAEFMNLPVEVRSSGCYIYSEAGEAYLDCGGYGVFLMGHCHPIIIEAVKKQLLLHPLSSRSLLNPELARAAEALVAITPEELDHVFLTNSGAEAVELALKLARARGRRKIVAMKQGYHGKTLGALSVTGREHYQIPFQPLLPDIHFVKFGDENALETLLSSHKEEYCVILEPIQAEGGVNVAQPGFLTAVRDLCDRYQAIMILDEIQTGMGRLGMWWGAMREQIVPDILLVGKGLSGGVIPVGAVIRKEVIFKPISSDPVLHSSTFGGNPLAAVAVQAAIRVIEEENLISRTSSLGLEILAMLRSILNQTCSKLIKEVRGVGLLIGIEFLAEHYAADFMLELLSRGVITSHSLNASRVLRLTPPAILKDTDIKRLTNAVQEAGLALHSRYG